MFRIKCRVSQGSEISYTVTGREKRFPLESKTEIDMEVIGQKTHDGLIVITPEITERHGSFEITYGAEIGTKYRNVSADLETITSGHPLMI